MGQDTDNSLQVSFYLMKKKRPEADILQELNINL